MEAICEKRHNLINGLTKLYDLLATMRYISAEHVLQPPHVVPAVDTERMPRLGLDDEVVALASLLPVLRDDMVWRFQYEGTQIAPRSWAAYYFVQDTMSVGIDLFDLWIGQNEKASPYELTIGCGKGFSGTNLLYNVRDRTIAEKRYATGKNSAADPYGRPSDIVLAEMLANLQHLEWVSFLDPNDRHEIPERQIVENPLVFENLRPFGLFHEPVPVGNDADTITAGIEVVRRVLGPVW